MLWGVLGVPSQICAFIRKSWWDVFFCFFLFLFQALGRDRLLILLSGSGGKTLVVYDREGRSEGGVCFRIVLFSVRCVFLLFSFPFSGTWLYLFGVLTTGMVERRKGYPESTRGPLQKSASAFRFQGEMCFSASFFPFSGT